jgi:hypothetical protein
MPGSATASTASTASNTFAPHEAEHLTIDSDTPDQDARGMDYWIAIFFLALYYVRPHDWVPGFAGVNIIRPVMAAWIIILLINGLRSPLPGWLRTPHDWIILTLFAYVAWTSPPGIGATSGMFSLVVFYFLTVQALTSWNRVLGYLKAWLVCLIIVATFGVLQTLGLDITNGSQITQFFVGRLSLGTWLTNNPNALGHTIIPAIPLAYIIFFWRGSAFNRLFLFPAAVSLVGWCAWMTQSKGSFLVGAGLTVMIFVVGRPKWVQILVVSLAFSFGVGALSFLPRMEEMGNLRSDEGVMGRVMAWEMALSAMNANTYGVGWKQFIALIDWKDGAKWIYDIPKATHSSYVQVGADLGRSGLFLWILGLWSALRAVLFLKAQTENEERCRRAVLLLLLAYLASSWMVNRQYHTEYFLLIAAAAAIHRLALTAKATPSPTPIPSEDTLSDAANTNPSISSPGPGKLWRRLDWIDLVAGCLLTWAALSIWDYVLKNL